MANNNNVWRNAFKSGGDIPGSAVRNGNQSKVALCSLNKSDRATIAFSLTASIIGYLDGRTSIGKVNVNGEEYLWTENKSKNVPGRKYLFAYDPSDKRLFATVMESGANIPYELAKDNYVHWSVFSPRIAEILLDNPQGEFADSFKTVKDEFLQKGVLGRSNDLFILNDYLYQTRDDYITYNNQVEKLNLNQVDIELIEDLTPGIMGKQGCFEFASSAPKKSHKKSSTSKAKSGNPQEANAYKLEWDRELTDEEKSLIPNHDLSVMKLAPEIVRIVKVIKKEHNSQKPVNNIMLYGDAGAGKSTGAQLIAQLLGVPYEFENFSLNSEEGNIIGTYLPKEDGTFQFCETAFIRRFRDGGVFEAMELSFAEPATLGKINSALDATATLITANGEKIKRHPNFVLIGTTNIGYAGCKPMNASFVSRFHRIVKVEKLPAGDLLEIVINQSGNSDRVLVKKMIDAVEKISIKIKEEQIINGVSSTRELINWANETKYTSDPIESARVTILPSVGFDEELQEEIIDTILRPMF